MQGLLSCYVNRWWIYCEGLAQIDSTGELKRNLLESLFWENCHIRQWVKVRWEQSGHEKTWGGDFLDGVPRFQAFVETFLRRFPIWTVVASCCKGTNQMDFTVSDLHTDLGDFAFSRLLSALGRVHKIVRRDSCAYYSQDETMNRWKRNGIQHSATWRENKKLIIFASLRIESCDCVSLVQ
jgi:hypothetical protein